jgi:hypothetical protein
MFNLGFDELNGLAEAAADEIREGFTSYDGKKWKTVDGKERVVTFNVETPSLKGRKVSQLDPRGLLCASFDSRLRLAGGKYVEGYLCRRTLDGIHHTLEIANGVYTGRVAVSEAVDYDP